MTPKVRLHWEGKPENWLAPSSSTPSFTEVGEHTLLAHCDNLLLKNAPELLEKVQLAYLDPPFFTQSVLSSVLRKNKLGGYAPPKKKKIYGHSTLRSLPEEVEAEKSMREKTRRDSDSPIAEFDDRWPSLSAYLEFLGLRLATFWPLIVEGGSLVLHIDPKTSHYAKVLCDEVLGVGNYASEIIWRYRRWPSKARNYQRVHDVLLRYVKNPDKAKFRTVYEPLAHSTHKNFKGRQQLATTDTAGSRRSMATSALSPGVPLGDVWDVSIVAPSGFERTGYPTQKPTALLKRLVETLTDPGDLILDPFCGSGSMLEVAVQTRRRAVGLDQSAAAIAVTTERVQNACAKHRP